MELPLLVWLTNQEIPFRVTENNVVIVDSSKCTDHQKDEMLKIEREQYGLVGFYSS